MATHSATAPASIPSTTRDSPHRVILHTVLANIGRAFRAIGAFFDSLIAAQQAIARYERLARMSETELAARGIKREDIPHYVFRQA
jgi:hypothetical protein